MSEPALLRELRRRLLPRRPLGHDAGHRRIGWTLPQVCGAATVTGG